MVACRWAPAVGSTAGWLGGCPPRLRVRAAASVPSCRAAPSPPRGLPRPVVAVPAATATPTWPPRLLSGPRARGCTCRGASLIAPGRPRSCMPLHASSCPLCRAAQQLSTRQVECLASAACRRPCASGTPLWTQSGPVHLAGLLLRVLAAAWAVGGLAKRCCRRGASAACGWRSARRPGHRGARPAVVSGR